MHLGATVQNNHDDERAVTRFKRGSLFSKIRHYKFRDLLNNLTMLL